MDLNDYLGIIKEEVKVPELVKLPSRIVWFTHFWPKLKHPLWPTMRLDKGKHYYKVGLNYQVKLGSWRKPKESELLGICQLIGKRQLLISEISTDLAYFDAGCTLEELKAQFAQWYSTSEHWKGEDTKMIVLFCLWIKKGGKYSGKNIRG